MTRVPENVQGIAVMHELRGLARDTVNDFVKEQGGLPILEHTHASSQWANPNSQIHNPADLLTYQLPNMNGVEIIIQLLHKTWGPDEQQLNLDYMTDFFSLHVNLLTITCTVQNLFTDVAVQIVDSSSAHPDLHTC